MFSNNGSMLTELRRRVIDGALINSGSFRIHDEHFGSYHRSKELCQRRMRIQGNWEIDSILRNEVIDLLSIIGAAFDNSVEPNAFIGKLAMQSIEGERVVLGKWTVWC